MHRFHGTDPESIERRLAELARVAEEAEDRRAHLRSVGLLLFWPAIAVVGMGWGFQMDDRVAGQTVFFLFLAVGNLGILATLVAAYLRGS